MKQSIGTLTSIIEELAETLKILDAPQRVQSIINSFNDSLDDEEVLGMLRDWNRLVHASGRPPVAFPGEPDSVPARNLTDEQLAEKYRDPDEEEDNRIERAARREDEGKPDSGEYDGTRFL